MALSCYISYICALMNCRTSITSIPHQLTLVCPLCIIYPFSLPACPNDVPPPWQVFISFHVCSPYPPCAKLVPHFFRGDVFHPITLTNEDYMAPQFSSPYFSHASWSIFHHPSDNSPWDTHIYPQSKPLHSPIST